MKLTKGMAYYFGFWILYLPLSIILTLMLNLGLEEFFVSLGLGALILLVFLSIRLLIIKLSEKDAPSVPSSEDYSGNPPAHGHINYTTIHEMMHVVFEDFYKENFDNSLPREKYFDFLEIMNYIVLNLPQIRAITKWVSYPYPNQEQRCKHLEKVYKDCKNMKEFVGKAIPYLKETKDL